jgi:hypothetical protein
MFAADLSLDSRYAPPNPPWQVLEPADASSGYVAVYYSDPLCRLPVREVTRPRDNKSDPNLETGTFGLFSVCERDMRAGLVRRRSSKLFFITSHGRRPRALVGYYDVGWWAYGKLSGRSTDVCLAAKELWFVDPPIPVTQLPTPACDVMSTRFRTVKRVDAVLGAQLVKILRNRDDATAEYVREIDRLERFNQHHTGYRCWRRTEPFSWAAATGLISSSAAQSLPQTIANSSPSGAWCCRECSFEFLNRSRLKECPKCHEHDTLIPSV